MGGPRGLGAERGGVAAGPEARRPRDPDPDPGSKPEHPVPGEDPPALSSLSRSP